MFLADNCCVPQHQLAPTTAKPNGGVSRADFINKIGTVQKEAAETQCWLELRIESSIAKDQAAVLLQEASELLAIFTSIGKKLKG